MAITKKLKEQPIESVTISRKGFSAIEVTKTESGKFRIAAKKEGVAAYLLSATAAAELVQALNLYGVKAAA